MKSRKKNQKKIADECWHKNIDVIAETALYYGFTPTDEPTITKEDIKKAKAICETEIKNKDSSNCLTHLPVEEKIALHRLFQEKDMLSLPQPVMMYFSKPFNCENSNKKSNNKEREIRLEIMGTQRSIAEALLIKTALEILKEEGFENTCVHINSIGERENVARFSRELSNYYRKNIETLPSNCRQLLKKDPFELLSCDNEKCCSLKQNAPKSLNFLSEQSRQHFKEVLEHLEILDIPYEIDPYLVSNKSFACQTIFEIHDQDEKDKTKPLAVGIRYCNIAKKVGMKKDLPGIGVRLNFKEKKAKKNLKFLKPKIYFIQLGFEAKLKSLKIIEVLRQAKIPVHHAISKDKLIAQLSTAENMKIPFTIIMGQKEALENSVIVRNMTNRSQESIKIENLSKHLRNL